MPRASDSLASVLAGLSKALRKLRLPWYVFGAQALVLRGYPRATADLDVTVFLGEETTDRLVRELHRHGFVPTVVDEGFLAATRVLPVVHRPSGFPVDIVLGGPGLEEIFAKRAEPVRVGRVMVPVATPTHLVVMKVLSGRPKDIDDATALLALRDEAIDESELDKLAQEISRALSDDEVLANLREAKRRSVELRRRRRG